MWSKENLPPLEDTTNNKHNNTNQLSWKNIDFAASLKKPDSSHKPSKKHHNRVFDGKPTKDQENSSYSSKSNGFPITRSAMKKQLPSTVKKVSFCSPLSHKRTRTEDEEEMDICAMYEESRDVIHKNKLLYLDSNSGNLQSKQSFVKEGNCFMENEQNYTNNAVPPLAEKEFNHYNAPAGQPSLEEEDDVPEDFMSPHKNDESNISKNNICGENNFHVVEKRVLKSIENVSQKTEDYDGEKQEKSSKENLKKQSLDLALYDQFENRKIPGDKNITPDVHTCSKLDTFMSLCRPLIVDPVNYLLRGFTPKHHATILSDKVVLYGENIAPEKQKITYDNLKVFVRGMRQFSNYFTNQKNGESLNDTDKLPHINFPNHNHPQASSETFEKVILLDGTSKNVRRKRIFLMPLVSLNHKNEHITNELYISSKISKDANINPPTPLPRMYLTPPPITQPRKYLTPPPITQPIKTFPFPFITKENEEASSKPIKTSFCRALAPRKTLLCKPSMCVRHNTMARQHKLKSHENEIKKNKIFRFKPSLKNLRKKIAYLKKKNFFFKTKNIKPKDIKTSLKMKLKNLRDPKNMNQCQSNKGDSESNSSTIDFKNYFKTFKNSSLTLLNRLPKFSKKQEEEEENLPVFKDVPNEATSRFNNTPKLFPNQMLMELLNSQFNQTPSKTPPPVPKPPVLTKPPIVTKQSFEAAATQTDSRNNRTILKSLISSLKQNSQYNSKLKQIQSINRNKISGEVKPLLLPHPLHKPPRPDPPLKYNSFHNEKTDFKK